MLPRESADSHAGRVIAVADRSPGGLVRQTRAVPLSDADGYWPGGNQPAVTPRGVLRWVCGLRRCSGDANCHQHRDRSARGSDIAGGGLS